MAFGTAASAGASEAQSLDAPLEGAPALSTDGAPMSDSVIVPFRNGRTNFQPNSSQAEKLKEAPAAALVVVRGRTSTNKPSRSDERLALQRALSARSYLMHHGVSPLKINLNFVSAADYLTENTTPEGQAANQRVEVELIYVPAQP